MSAVEKKRKADFEVNSIKRGRVSKFATNETGLLDSDIEVHDREKFFHQRDGVQSLLILTEALCERGNPLMTHYTLESFLGRGTFGLILGGTRVADNRPIAIKIIKKWGASNLVVNEFMLQKKMNFSEYSLNCLNYYETDHFFYAVLDLVDSDWRLAKKAEELEMHKYITVSINHSRRGINDIQSMKRLRLVIRHCAADLASILYTNQGWSALHLQRVDSKLRHKISCGIVNGVHHMHQQRMVHGDLKAENILITKTHDVKIADFGFARNTDDKRIHIPSRVNIV